MSDPAPPLLVVEHLHKSFFGVPVLRDVGFSLGRGEVLGLVGENGSGKSTTMNILGGVHRPDSGRMTLDGQSYDPLRPRDAQASGIATVHQELSLFPNLSIEENLFLGSFPRLAGRAPLIARRRMRARARQLLALVDLRLPPGTPVGRLPQGERQLVEIAKALGQDAKLIIFDEPTTSLTAREAERLFGIIARLRDQGIAVIYISHILGDVLRLADHVVVLRDGQVVGSGPRAQWQVEGMISLMVGRTIDQLFPTRPPCIREEGPPALEARGLSQPGVVQDVGFKLRPGEVLGISGLMGSGRSELARILFGLDPYARGEVLLHGAPLPPLAPRIAMERGMAFLTEDRRAEGLMMEASVADNAALPSVPDHASRFLRLVRRTELGEAVRHTVRAVQVNARDLDATLVKALSGGNQQKVVIAKWLLRRPSVFILDEPTRGIDVGAKYEVYKIINGLVAEGGAVLFISSEIEELIGMCDRILVMSRGEVRSLHERAGFDRESLLRSALWEPAAALAATARSA